MFRKHKGDGKENPGNGNAGERDLNAPPLKPFSKQGTHGTGNPTAGKARRDIPRQVADIPGSARRAERGRPSQGEGNKLIVGRDIHLKGEITACDKLVVEGRVEASLTDARVIEVAPSGYYKGDAQVEEADISGLYEGDLIAREKLTVRAQGRISGSIRYGRIVIESGGEISGDMQTLKPKNQDSARPSSPEDREPSGDRKSPAVSDRT